MMLLVDEDEEEMEWTEYYKRMLEDAKYYENRYGCDCEKTDEEEPPLKFFDCTVWFEDFDEGSHWHEVEILDDGWIMLTDYTDFDRTKPYIEIHKRENIRAFAPKPDQ